MARMLDRWDPFRDLMSTQIHGERRSFHEDTSDDSFRRIERRYGQFTRTVTLPSTFDVEKIDARFEKGVLTIEVPKREVAKPRKIAVKAS